MRIVIRVIASKTHGLGHVYRAMTLAEEFERLGHDVGIACYSSTYPLILSLLDDVNFATNRRCLLGAGREVGDLLESGPDLIINDILNTDAVYIEQLKADLL